MSKPNHETSPHAPGGHPEAHGSSVGFYVFIAVVLGIITYIEFALVEHQDTWFAWMSRFWLFFWLILLSVIKFVLVVMFFMHLKQDHRAFTGFFSSGMVIAVGTLAALAALFTVRSIAEAQAPGEPHTEAHAEAHVGEDTRTLSQRFEYPAPKTQEVARTELRPTVPGSQDGSGAGLGADVLASGEERALLSASIEDPRTTPTGFRAGDLPFPLAEPAPPVTLPNPFSADGAPVARAAPQAAQQGEATQEQAPAEPAVEGGAEGETEGEAAAAPAGDAPLLVDADLSAGEGAYSANCASCHQANGAGIPGAFPPLVGHTPELALAEGGRDYLVNLLLYGLQGEIQVEGQSYNGVMPAWQQLSDEELASILNYTLTEWDNLSALPEDYAAFTPEEVAEQRDTGLTAADVYEQRQALLP